MKALIGIFIATNTLAIFLTDLKAQRGIEV
jgi:hypothetical protein